MWYKSGTISVAANSTTVTGVDTLWTVEVKTGDIFTVDASQWYEVADVVNDNELTLATAFPSALTNSPYAVIRNFARQTPADLALSISTLVNKWERRENELIEYLTETGLVDLTDVVGNTHTVSTPKKLDADVAAAIANLSQYSIPSILAEAQALRDQANSAVAKIDAALANSSNIVDNLTLMESWKDQTRSDKNHVDSVKTAIDTTANTVSGHRNAVDTAAAQVAADKATVATDKATVAADKATVAADKATVAADKATVAADKATVSADKAAVAADKTVVQAAKTSIVNTEAQVTALRDETLSARDVTVTNAGSASTSATQAAASATAAQTAKTDAEKYAIHPVDVEITAGVFSSLHYATKAAQATSGMMRFQGFFNPVAGYPTNPIAGDFFVASATGQITSSANDATNDGDYHAGDQVIWDGNKWFKIDNSDRVSSVAGKTGNVALGITDILNLQNELDSKVSISTSNNFTTVNTFAGGGQALALSAGATSNHVYMSFFADSTNLSTRSGYVGYTSANTNTLSLVNEKGGDLALSAPSASLKFNGGDVFHTGNFGKTQIENFGINAMSVDGLTASNIARTDIANPYLTVNSLTAPIINAVGYINFRLYGGASNDMTISGMGIDMNKAGMGLSTKGDVIVGSNTDSNLIVRYINGKHNANNSADILYLNHSNGKEVRVNGHTVLHKGNGKAEIDALGINASSVQGRTPQPGFTNGTIAQRGTSGEINAGDFSTYWVNGRGLRFWNNDAYKIYMSSRDGNPFGTTNELSTAADYNMYFRMDGNDKGFVFWNKTKSSIPAAQITGSGDVYARRSFRLGGVARKLEGGGSNSIRLRTPSGYVDIGPANTAFCHFITDRYAFYFGKRVYVNGPLKIYNSSTRLEAAGLIVGGGARRGKLTVSTAGPSGSPADGDEWVQY